MNWFLKAKHWQIFLLVFGLPFVADLVMFPVIFFNREPSILFGVFGIVMLLVIYIQFGWMYSVSVFLHPKLPPGAGMNLKRFKLFFWVPIIYFSLWIIIGLSAFVFFLTKQQPPHPGPWIGFIGLIIPLHLFSIFCIFHTIWFIAKSLKSVEWQRPVFFSDYIGDFFLLWFYVIGVWFIQPRINWQFHNDIHAFYAKRRPSILDQDNPSSPRSSFPSDWKGFGN